jgi:hypothetical protein
MPIFRAACECGWSGDKYLHKESDRENTHTCKQCTGTIHFLPSFGVGLTYFRESQGGTTIHNLGHKPVQITSPAHHREEMKKAGVSLAPQRYGEKGCWV